MDILYINMVYLNIVFQYLYKHLPVNSSSSSRLQVTSNNSERDWKRLLLCCCKCECENACVHIFK